MGESKWELGGRVRRIWRWSYWNFFGEKSMKWLIWCYWKGMPPIPFSSMLPLFICTFSWDHILFSLISKLYGSLQKSINIGDLPLRFFHSSCSDPPKYCYSSESSLLSFASAAYCPCGFFAELHWQAIFILLFLGDKKNLLFKSLPS